MHYQKSILDIVFVYDIIYAEVTEEGAGGCPGEAMFYVIQSGKLVCYVTRIFENKGLYIKIKDLLYSKCDINNEHVGEVLFNYDYGGLGNNVFINKNTRLNIIEKHFTLDKNDKQYHIYTSVPGVFNSVVFPMQKSEA